MAEIIIPETIAKLSPLDVRSGEIIIKATIKEVTENLVECDSNAQVVIKFKAKDVLIQNG